MWYNYNLKIIIKSGGNIRYFSESLIFIVTKVWKIGGPGPSFLTTPLIDWMMFSHVGYSLSVCSLQCAYIQCPLLPVGCQDERLTDILVGEQTCKRCPACYDNTVFNTAAWRHCDVIAPPGRRHHLCSPLGEFAASGLGEISSIGSCRKMNRRTGKEWEDHVRVKKIMKP